VNAVFEAGNFSAAARRLGVSQPSVAQLVRELESEFDVRLFDRHGHSLVATPLCRQLYAATNRIQAMEADAVAILEQREELAGGELRVGLGNSMPGMALISSFKGLYPKIQIALKSVTGPTSCRCDRSARRCRRTSRCRKIAVSIRGLPQPAGRRDLPSRASRKQGQVSIAELMEYPLVFRTGNSSTQRVVDRLSVQQDCGPSPRSWSIRGRHAEAVANQLGIGFIWEHGSSRIDRIAKVVVTEMDVELPEYIFSLIGAKGKLVELFFRAQPVAVGVIALSQNLRPMVSWAGNLRRD
jgi:DNA-binding transcriptional LysR family regulator